MVTGEGKGKGKGGWWLGIHNSPLFGRRGGGGGRNFVKREMTVMHLRPNAWVLVRNSFPDPSLQSLGSEQRSDPLQRKRIRLF